MGRLRVAIIACSDFVWLCGKGLVLSLGVGGMYMGASDQFRVNVVPIFMTCSMVYSSC
jgi:hypothetical protein